MNSTTLGTFRCRFEGPFHTITVAEAEKELASALATPLDAFVPGLRKFRPSKQKHTSLGSLLAAANSSQNILLAALGETDDEPEGEPKVEDAAVLAERDTSRGEELIRRRLSAYGEAFIADMEQDCPSQLSIQFTNKPDLRLKLRASEDHRERVLLTLSTSRGLLNCETIASVSACWALGFEAEALHSGPFTAKFEFNPEQHTATNLFCVAGAAIQSMVNR